MTKLVAKLCMEQDIFKRSSSDRIVFDRFTRVEAFFNKNFLCQQVFKFLFFS